MKYVTDKLDLSMIPMYARHYILNVIRLSPQDFCANLDEAVYIGSRKIADIIETLCISTLKKAGGQKIALKPYEHLYIVLCNRCEEVEKPTRDDVIRMYRDGRIAFYHVFYEPGVE